MRRKVISLILAILGMISMAYASKIYLNFNQIEIKDFLEFIGKTLHKNILYDNSLRGRVSVMFHQPVDKKTVWKVLNEVISMAGGVIYEERGYIKVISQKKFKEITPRAGERLKAQPAEPYLLVYQLKHLNALQLARHIKSLLSRKGYVITIPGTQIIIIKDLAKNLKEIKHLLELIDAKASAIGLKIFELTYADAGELSKKLNLLLQIPASERKVKYKVVAEERSNSIIVYGDEEILKLAQKIIAQLDKPPKREEKKFYIIPLKYASAEKLEKTLKKLNISRVLKNKKSEVFSIGADPTTNSLIFFGSAEDFERLKKLIEKLDVKRKQVLLVATILEVSWDKFKDLGVHWQALGNYGGIAFGGSSLSDVFNLIHQGNLVMGAFSTGTQTITLGETELLFPDLLFLFSLLEQGSSFQILSNPKILTLDNQKAEIKVGESVPYTTGITYQTNTLPTVSFDYRDVGLDLTITPHICGNNVRLEIHQTLQDVTQIYRATQGTIDFVAPSTSKREISSQIVVANGQTVILGGLISRKRKTQNSKVPFLSSIPGLGYLFKNTHEENQKTTLFVFLTPYIIDSPEKLKKITEEHEVLARDLQELLKFYQKKDKK